MTVSATQPSEAEACQATSMIAGRSHPIHSRPWGTVSRSIAAKTRGPTPATALSAISVNPISRARWPRAAPLGVALPWPDNVPDADRRRDQAEFLETVRDRLLLGEDVIVEWPERELRSINGSLLRSEI